jgi:hypothetical protein
MTSRNPPLPCSEDRRYRQRFTIQLPLKWRTADHDFVTGRTRNMSRYGLSIGVTGGSPKVGAMVDVVVDWPVRLNGMIGLQLWISGKVVRSSAREFAVRYQGYAIKTNAVRAQAEAVEFAALKEA